MLHQKLRAFLLPVIIVDNAGSEPTHIHSNVVTALEASHSVGLEASGAEEGWDVSDRFGLSARWAYDAAGEGFEAQQALAQDSADFSGVFPLLSGDRRAGRMLRIEVAP